MKTLCDKITKKKSRRSLLLLKSHFRICAISIVHTKTIRKIFTFCHRVKRYSRHHCTALLAAAFTPKYHFLHVMFPKWEISTGEKMTKSATGHSKFDDGATCVESHNFLHSSKRISFFFSHFFHSVYLLFGVNIYRIWKSFQINLNVPNYLQYMHLEN